MDNFRYDNFDRQLENLVASTHVLVSGWDDIKTIEMNIDLKSLSLKASRLCAMADVDFALQQQSLTYLRVEANNEWLHIFDSLIKNELVELVKRVVYTVKSTGRMEGHNMPMFPCEMTNVIKRLAELLSEDDNDSKTWGEMVSNTDVMERTFNKKYHRVVFPGMDFRERFWLLYEVFSLMCYLLYHFHRTVELCSQIVPAEAAGDRLRNIVNQYAQSEAGQNELERYMMSLQYDNDNNVTLELLSSEKKRLKDDVPESLQLCYMKHIGNIDALANELLSLDITEEEYNTLIDVLAKYQMLGRQIYTLIHPEKQESELFNEVFTTISFNRHVDLKELRERIGRMVKLVKHKNHWFCVWSVLKHKGFLANTSYSAFARQMMHNDWFGDVPSNIRFNADTLSDYSGYFTDIHYTVWNETAYTNYRITHGKTKWGINLWATFQRLCFDMEQAFEGEFFD